MTAQSAKSIYFTLICALVVATCHADGGFNDPRGIRDYIPSKHHTSEALPADQVTRNRKLMALKKDWTPLWADEFDSWDSSKWSYQFGDGCQLDLCGWGNQELVSAL